MQQSSWETLYGSQGFDYNLFVLGEKQGSVLTAPTYVVAIAFPNGRNIRLRGYRPEELELAKEWVIRQVRQWHESVIAELTPTICKTPAVKSGDSL